MDNTENPEPTDDLGFVFDRVSILRRANGELSAYGMSYDVADLLETAAWLAGDALAAAPDLPVWSSSTEETGESEETGA
jgi:hypothetical protein